MSVKPSDELCKNSSIYSYTDPKIRLTNLIKSSPTVQLDEATACTTAILPCALKATCNGFYIMHTYDVDVRYMENVTYGSTSVPFIDRKQYYKMSVKRTITLEKGFGQTCML